MEDGVARGRTGVEPRVCEGTWSIGADLLRGLRKSVARRGRVEMRAILPRERRGPGVNRARERLAQQPWANWLR